MKTITRTVLNVVKEKGQYHLTLAMQGYERSGNDKHSLTTDQFYIGAVDCKDQKILMQLFSKGDYDHVVFHDKTCPLCKDSGVVPGKKSWHGFIRVIDYKPCPECVKAGRITE